MTSLILPAPASIIELVKCSVPARVSALKRVVTVTRTIYSAAQMCKCKDLCKNKPPRTNAYDLSMTNYQVMMKNSENIHVPVCLSLFYDCIVYNY